MQGARIWLPNIEGFFTSLGRLLESAEGQRNTASYDSAEFFIRRLRENKRTLVTLALRIEEAFPNEVEVISDLNELVFIMNELSRDFDRIVEDSERSTFSAPASLDDRLSAVARNDLVGYQVVTDVTAREAVNFDHYGIDEEWPVPDVQSDYAVSVPDTITTLTHNQELSLQEARDAVFQTGDHDGIIAYQVVLQIASFYLNCCS